jgi:hypothetical protein
VKPTVEIREIQPENGVDECRAGILCPMNMTAVRSKLAALLVLSLLFVTTTFAQDLDLIGSVGWQKFGRGIQIRAEEVSNDRPSGASGFLRLQIWATDALYDGSNDLTGFVLGTFNLGPLDAGFSFVNLSRIVRFFRPPPGIYFTTITLEEEDVTGTFFIMDFENFVDPVNFGGFGEGFVDDVESAGDVTFVGDISWQAGNGRVEIFAERIQNERTAGRSGVLRVRLWATTTPYNGGDLQGYPLATRRVGRVLAGFYLPDVVRRGPFRLPLIRDEYYYTTLTLEELVRGRWEIVDFVTFPEQSLF